jgi:hypothetical protein
MEIKDDEIVSALVDLIYDCHRDAANQAPPSEVHGIFHINLLAFSQANFVKGNKEALAKKIVTKAFDAYFSEQFIEKDGMDDFSDRILHCLGCLSNSAIAALLSGFQKMNPRDSGLFIHKAILATKDSVVEDTFMPKENLAEFKITLDEIMRKMFLFVTTTTKNSESPLWFCKVVPAVIACLISFKFAWFPPSKAVISDIITKRFQNQEAGFQFAESTWVFLTKKSSMRAIQFPKWENPFQWQLFPSWQWFKSIKFPNRSFPIFPEAYETFVLDTCASLHPMTPAEFVPLPVGRVFVAYQKELLANKSKLTSFETDYLKLKMLCQLALSDSNGFPLPNLFSATLHMMEKRKMVKVTETRDSTTYTAAGICFYKRLNTFGACLGHVVEYHFTFWKVFIDKDVLFFHLPFSLFENFFMELVAITNFHIKSLNSIVNLVNIMEPYIAGVLKESFQDDAVWLTEYILQAIAIAANCISSDVSTYITSLVSNEKLLHLYAIMQSDKRCFFNKPCDRDNLFTYEPPSIVEIKDLGISVRLNSEASISSSFTPSITIPLLNAKGFEIAILRTLHEWFTFYKKKNLSSHSGGLEFVCDRIAEDIWFAQIGFRVNVESLRLYRDGIEKEVRRSVKIYMASESDHETLVTKVMKRLVKLLINQVDDRQIVPAETSQFIWREFMSTYLLNLQAQTKYQVSSTMIIVQQYLGIQLKEYGEFSEMNSYEWTKNFRENRQTSTEISFDFLDVPPQGIILDRYNPETIYSLALVGLTVAVSRALKELHSVEYTKNFGDKIPMDFLFSLQYAIGTYKSLNKDIPLEDWAESRDLLTCVLESCVSARYDEDISYYLNLWIISDPLNDESRYYRIIQHPQVLTQEDCSAIEEIGEELLNYFKAGLQLPTEYSTLVQTRNKFQFKLEALLEQYKCHHLIRSIIKKAPIDPEIKAFLFKPYSFMSSNADETLIMRDTRYLNCRPNYTLNIIRLKPFNLDIRLGRIEKLPGQTTGEVEEAPAAENIHASEGLSSGKETESEYVDSLCSPTGNLFNEIEDPHANIIAPVIVEDAQGIEEITIKLKGVFQRFDDQSSLITRDEPLSEFEIKALEDAVEDAVGDLSKVAEIQKIDIQPAVYKSVLLQILDSRQNNGAITTEPSWFAEYQDPRIYQNVFNGKTSAKYSPWRSETLEKIMHIISSKAETGNVKNLVTQKLRNPVLVQEVNDHFSSHHAEKEALISLIKLWDVRYGYKEPKEWSESQLKASIMQVVNGIESDADYETGLFACSWPVEKFEAFIQRVAHLKV